MYRTFLLLRRGWVAVGRSAGAVHACVPALCRLCVNCSGVARVHPDSAYLPFTPPHLWKSSRGRPRKKENAPKNAPSISSSTVVLAARAPTSKHEHASKLIVPACATPSRPIDPSFVPDIVQVRQRSLFSRAIRPPLLLSAWLQTSWRGALRSPKRKKKK